MTSSPIDHLDLDFEGMNLDRSSDQEESNVADNRQSSLEQGLDDLAVTPPAEELPEEDLANRVITANQHQESHNEFRRRMSSLPGYGELIARPKFDKECTLSLSEDVFVSENGSWEAYVNVEGWTSADKFRRWESDSRSYEQDQLTMEDPYEDVIYLGDLFDEEKEIDPFNEKNLNQDIPNELIIQKTKNKLYQIFTMQCPNVKVKIRGRNIHCGQTGTTTPQKRKVAPTEELDTNRPVKTPHTLTASPGQRVRANTVLNLSTVRAKTTSKRQVPATDQLLLTDIWKRNGQVDEA